MQLEAPLVAWQKVISGKKGRGKKKGGETTEKGKTGISPGHIHQRKVEHGGGGERRILGKGKKIPPCSQATP